MNTSRRLNWRDPLARFAAALLFACVLPIGQAATSPRDTLGATVTPMGLPGLGLPPADTCDPTRASCIPPTCSPLDAALGKCKPGDPPPVDPGPGGPGGGGSCTIPPGGSPTCGGSGPAAKDATGPAPGGGNPINLINGNKYQEETDLAALPGMLGLELKRYYNSQSTHPGLLGVNWRMSYETVLYDFGSQIQIVQADGQRLTFQRGVGGHASLCTSAQVQDGQVRIEEPKDGKGQRVYHWRWPDGRTLSFSSGSGGGFPLQAITAASGQRTTLNYSPTGDLISIRDPQGRKLSFIYANASQQRSRALQAIDTPLGRLSFTQDKLGRLTEVASSKDAKSAPYQTKVYHYEDKYNGGHVTALTGISVRSVDAAGKAQEQRLSTYAYNQAGQAILSTKGRPRELKDGKPVEGTGIDQIDVAFVEKSLPYEGKVDKATGEVVPKQMGKTILTNSLGQKTEILHAVIGGRFRLIEMRGPGCSTCGPSNMRYAYDGSGQIVRSSQLNADGSVGASELRAYDSFGRLVKIGSQQLLSDGKREPVQWLRRYEYPDQRFKDGSMAVAQQPSLVAQPSVVAGKEHVMRFAYNDLGQVVRIVEEGYAPIDEKGARVAAGALLSRETTYRYERVGNRSVLTQSDGPLANGPKGSPEDSDVTRYAYDSSGDRITSIVQPMGLAVRFEYDGIGRLSRRVGIDGIAESVGYDAQGHVARMERAGRAMFIERDAAGRVIEARDALGQVLRLDYDAAGRLVVIRDTQDNRIAWHYDSGDSVDEMSLINPDGSVSQRRVTASMQNLGKDAFGPSRPFLPDLPRPELPAEGLSANAFGMAPPQSERRVFDSDGRPTTYVYDDFGRMAAEESPVTGRTVFRFDAADHLVERVNSLGQRTIITLDLQGRAHKVHADGEDATIDWGAANKPVRIASRDADERFEYDAMARLTRHSLHVDGKTFSVRYEHDALGRITRKVLPGGEKLAFRYNGSVHGKPGLLAGIYREGLIDAPVVTGLNTPEERYADRGFIHGNGLSHRRLLDVEGRPVVVGSKAAAYSELQWAGSEDAKVAYRHPVATGGAAAADAKLPFLQRSAFVLSQIGADLNGERKGLPFTATPSADDQRYDARGRLIEDAARRYAWDGLDRLREVHAKGLAGTADVLVARYRYNLFGDRISKAVHSSAGQAITYFFHDGSQLAAEADADGKVLRDYVYLDQRPVAMLSGRAILAIHTDHRYAPIAVTDKNRQVVWQADLSTVGAAQVSPQSSISMPLRGSNQYFDAETGLHYNLHRYLDATKGRYISPDPMGLNAGPDLYEFALGRPDRYVDPLGLQPVSADVGEWSFADKLEEVVKIALKEKLPDDLATALREMVSPAKLATTAAIFALWAGSHAFGIGFAFDAVMLGVAYYMLGKAAADLVMGLIATTVAINNAKCRSDLDKAAGTLSKALAKGTAGFIEGALLRKVFSKTEGDLGATAIESLKKGVNYGKNKIVNAASSAAKLGFRAKSWAGITTNAERGFVGEIDAWSWLISGKAKLSALCCKTIEPNRITNQAEYDAALAAYRGTTGVDGAFASQPGFFRRIFGGKEQYYVVESKATADTFRYTTAELNGLLAKTTSGAKQLSTEWIGLNAPRGTPSRLTDAVGTTTAEAMRAASLDGRLSRVLATTDKNGTRYWQVIADPTDPKKVTVGAEITALFK